MEEVKQKGNKYLFTYGIQSCLSNAIFEETRVFHSKIKHQGVSRIVACNYFDELIV